LATAILATGASPKDALGMVAGIHGAQATLPSLLEALAELDRGWDGPSGLSAVHLLKALGDDHPDLALAGLRAWGWDRRIEGSLYLGCDLWLTNLPEGLRMDYDLILTNSGITALPDGLWVGGRLDLTETPLVTLPGGLWVGSDLDLTGCGRWDGRIPKDAHVGGLVRQDGRLGGVTLSQWRRLHPAPEGPSGPEGSDHAPV
jgi:hypothetical protein